MALQTFSQHWLSSLRPAAQAVSGSNISLDAVGEYGATIGQLTLQGGPGSKTLSAAGGGKIFWITGSGSTFASASTTLSLSLQDVSAGFPDGTADVVGDLIGGGGMSASVILGMTMTSGSKTVAHGDTIAIVLTMTAKGGSDLVQMRATGPGTFLSPGFPYGVQNTGTPTKSTGAYLFMIQFDDGTFGWIDPYCFSYNAFDATADGITSVNTGSTPDEYCAKFELPYACTLTSIGAQVGAVATIDPFDLILYSDPEGTPVVVETISFDPVESGDVTGVRAFIKNLVTPFAIVPDTPYAVAVRPTSTNSITYGYFAVGSSSAGVLRNCTVFGTTLKMMSRSNQTGAFSLVSINHLPILYLGINALSDNVGGGSGYGGGRGTIIAGGVGIYG